MPKSYFLIFGLLFASSGFAGTHGGGAEPEAIGPKLASAQFAMKEDLNL